MFTFDLTQLLKNFNTLKMTTKLEEKLDENLSLEEYLKNDEAILCYKDMNKNARKYFDKNKIKLLIKYVIEEPENDDYLRGHKFPFIASEMLKSANDRIQDMFVLTDEEYNEKYKEEKKNDDKNPKDNFINLLEKTPLEIFNLNKDGNKEIKLGNKDNNDDSTHGVEEEKKLENKDNNDDTLNNINIKKEKNDEKRDEKKENVQNDEKDVKEQNAKNEQKQEDNNKDLKDNEIKQKVEENVIENNEKDDKNESKDNNKNDVKKETQDNKNNEKDTKKESKENNEKEEKKEEVNKDNLNENVIKEEKKEETQIKEEKKEETQMKEEKKEENQIKEEIKDKEKKDEKTNEQNNNILDKNTNDNKNIKGNDNNNIKETNNQPGEDLKEKKEENNNKIIEDKKEKEKEKDTINAENISNNKEEKKDDEKKIIIKDDKNEKENKDNNIIQEKEENNNIIKEEIQKEKIKDICHNELLDTLLDFVMTDKSQLNDVLSGYFSNVLIPLMDKYPSKLFLYLYIIRKDALRQIVLRSYQKSLSMVSLKLLKVETYLNLLLNDVKKDPTKYSKDDLIQNVEKCCVYRDELVGEVILAITLDGYKDEKGNIIKDVDLDSLFSLLTELINEKTILTYIVYNSKIYNHILNILSEKVFVKGENNKNKQNIYVLFIQFLTKIFESMNKIKEGFDFEKDLNDKIDFFSILNEKESGNFIKKFIVVICKIILYNYVDISSINEIGEKRKKLGIHIIYIMDLMIEVFNNFKNVPLIFDMISVNGEFIGKSIDYFFKYQLNNIYQNKFNKFMKLYLDNESKHNLITEYLFTKIKFHETLIDYICQEEDKKQELILSKEKENSIPDKKEESNKNSNNTDINTNINENKIINNDVNDIKENKNEKNIKKNRYYYKSGRSTLSLMHTHVIELLYRMQAISGSKIFDEEEKKKLNIKNIGDFEFVKDETSNNNIVLIKNSQKINEILKSSSKWMHSFENKILPIIKKYESRLCGETPIKPPVTNKTPDAQELLKNLINLISSNDKLLSKKDNINNNNNTPTKNNITDSIISKYNDVNFWETKSSISQEIKDKIKKNQESKVETKNNKDNIISTDSEEKEDKKDIIDEEDELLGIAMKMEQNEKSEKSKKLPSKHNFKFYMPNSNSNAKTNAKDDSNKKLNINTPQNSLKKFLLTKENKNTKTDIDKNTEENNSKYNDTNYWQTKPESLLNEKEMQHLLDDL